MNTQNITIGILLVTAVILTAVLAGTYTASNQSVWAETSIRGGDYTMGTGDLPGSRSDLLYVINMAVQRMNVYHLNEKTNMIDLIYQVDLARAFRKK